MKTVVKLFQPRFAPLVKAGTKTQTIRKVPKRGRDMPKEGDELCAAEWTGRPYRSKQRVLMHGIITHVHFVYIAEGPEGQLLLSVGHGTVDDDDEFARKDGFTDGKEMLAWFRETHSLPFTGILIRWNPL